MTVNILYLYPDLMNLYGNVGNILCLERHIKENGIDVNVIKKSINDEISFDGFDFVYMGAGTERSRDRALSDFSKYKAEFLKYVENDGVALFSGNSFEMLGKQIIKTDESVMDGLCLFDYVSTETKRRIVIDTVCKMDGLENEIIGFMNKQTKTENVSTPLFSVIKGSGNAEKDYEGAFKNNLFASSLSGPILVRNPLFREFIEKKIYDKKGASVTPKSYENELSAYRESLKGLTE